MTRFPPSAEASPHSPWPPPARLPPRPRREQGHDPAPDPGPAAAGRHRQTAADPTTSAWACSRTSSSRPPTPSTTCPPRSTASSSACRISRTPQRQQPASLRPGPVPQRLHRRDQGPHGPHGKGPQRHPEPAAVHQRHAQQSSPRRHPAGAAPAGPPQAAPSMSQNQGTAPDSGTDNNQPQSTSPSGPPAHKQPAVSR